MAKFGLLYLNDGVTPDGQRILPKGWVGFSAELAPQSTSGITSQEDFKNIAGPYGKGSLWLNKYVTGIGKPFPHGPEDLLMAAGLSGQWILILPSQGLVFARTGHDKNSDTIANLDEVIATTVSCFGGGQL